MCGICGVFDPQGDAATATSRMLSQLHHRGPDDEGVWLRGPVGLGHRRLSINDLSQAGHQPMVTADGKHVLVANGEIYNYPELRRELETEGVRFLSNSDSEVLLHAFRAYGPESFDRLNGMVAFALYDTTTERLFLVRDRLGIKPLYYFHDPQTGRFLFASEIKAILAAAGRSSWSIDPQGLSQYLRYQNTFGAQTLFSGIRLLKPGHFLELDEGGLTVRSYRSGSSPRRPELTSFDVATMQFQEAFSSSVKRHLLSDVPVASYLSSGFDSSLVTRCAADHLNEPPAAFNGYFEEGGWYDETSGARLVADHVGVPLTEVPIGSEDFAESFDRLIYSLDEPRMGIGAFSQFIVAGAAARDRKVILTGHGGDELFSGYPIFKLASLFSAGSVAGLARSVSTIRPSEIPHIAYFLMRRLSNTAGSTHLPLLFSDRRLARALSPSGFSAVDEFDRFAELDEIADRSGTDYDRILQTYLTVYLPGLLVVEDKISMAHSLEARTPFLDNSLVDLSLSIAPETKLHDGQLKAIIKAAARQSLPGKLFELPKRGFPTPLSLWLRGPLREWLKNRVLAPGNVLHRVFQPGFLEQEVEGYLTSVRRHVRPLDEIQTHRIWMLLCLESWLRQIDERLGVTLEL